MAILFQHQQKQPYDIIHCHFGYNGLVGVILRDIGAVQGKVITTFHGIDVTNYVKNNGEGAYDLLFQLGDLFLPISELWKRRLIELGCNGNIIVHRMGIDCNKFTFTARKLRANGVVQIVTIARLAEKKGVEYAIRAVAKLAKSKTNLNYTIVGDGLLKERLQQLIQELNVDNIVTLVGWKQQQEVIEIINNSDIMLAPSVTSKDGDREGIPVVLMETMAMGLPIVSTVHSGIPELVENGVSGFLVPERDVDALAEKLNYLVENPEVWNKMGAAGRAFVEKYYNADKLNDKLVEIYGFPVPSVSNC
jgi:colanic acid/amylovoran biosynthesis glycosyltransferase